MIDILVSRIVEDKYGPMILSVRPGRVTLWVPTRESLANPMLRGCEVAVSGGYEGEPVFKELIAALPRLRWIHSTGAGMDGFVSEQLLRRGLLVTNSSGIYAPSMVEYVIAMLVSIRRNLPRYLTSQRDHVWLPGDPFLDGELRGKRVGIIGYGGVGRLLASVMDGLGMEVWASDVQPPPEAAMSYLARFVSSGDLPLLLEASDCIVVACPLTSKTRGMIGANELSKMRRGTILVNIARGPIVDEGALLEALSSGHLGAAVLDVAAEEPLPPTSPLWEAPNLLITPHISGDTLEGWERTMSLFCGNLGLYIDGNPEQMTNLVDLKAHI